MWPGLGNSRTRTGHLLVVALVAVSLAGCSSTKLSFTQTGKGGPTTYLLTVRECTWANMPDGGACLALTYQWDTHAGQFILEGVRSSYLRVVIRLADPLTGPGSGGTYDLGPQMVQAYDDDTDRGMCYAGGPGSITLQCDKDNKLKGSFEVTCRGFLPGHRTTGLFSDDYTLRARFEAVPDAARTLGTSKEVGWFFATPQRRLVPTGRALPGQ